VLSASIRGSQQVKGAISPCPEFDAQVAPRMATTKCAGM
jgi:hypothetical protein